MSGWPADAEYLHVHVAPHEQGSGPFMLTTRAWITSGDAVHQFHCAHRFQTVQARDEYRKTAEAYGIFESVSEETE